MLCTLVLHCIASYCIASNSIAFVLLYITLNAPTFSSDPNPYLYSWPPAAVRQQVKVYHPVDPNLGYVFGVMLTDGKDADNHSDNHGEPMANVVVFSGQVSC